MGLGSGSGSVLALSKPNPHPHPHPHPHPKFIQLLMRERETTIPPDDAMEVAKRVKEQYCYVCPDMAKEFRKYDDDPAKWTKKVNGFTKTSKP